MLLTDSAYTAIQVTAIILAVLIGGGCKFAAIFFLRQRRWKPGLACAGILFAILIVIVNIMNGDIDLGGNRILIVRERDGRPVGDEFRVFGPSKLTLASGVTLNLRAIPRTYIEEGTERHRSERMSQVVNDSRLPVNVKWRFYYGNKGVEATSVGPGQVCRFERRDAGGIEIIPLTP
jgi:hypothetical protein